MDPQLLAAILGAGGGGAVLLALVNGVMKWLSGASHREREKNTDLMSQRRTAIEDRDAAMQERDEEARQRREAEEHVAILQRQLLLAGIEPLPRKLSALQTQENNR
jgi:hypothetical protein